MYEKQNINFFLMKTKSYIMYRTCANLFYMLNENHIPYAVVKGEALSMLAYGKCGQRISHDIDILISRKSLGSLKILLTENGFYCKELERRDEILMLSASHQTSPWKKKAASEIIEIDLNFDIFWGEYSGKRISIEGFLENTVEMDIYGQIVKTLQPLKAMIELILHHFKEMNSLYHLSRHNSINRSMFQDVYYLWKNNQEAISLEKLHETVTECGIIQYAFYVLYFTNMIYQDYALNEYVDAFRTQEGEKLLDYYGLTEKEQKKWKVDFWTRLEEDNLYALIKEQLTNEDMEKLERSRRIFT